MIRCFGGFLDGVGFGLELEIGIGFGFVGLVDRCEVVR